MIVSYPLVNDNGTLTGCEVSFRLTGLYAIENMNRWVRTPRTIEDALQEREREDHYEPIPGCVVVYLARGEFNIQADYADLKAKMIDFNEWNED